MCSLGCVEDGKCSKKYSKPFVEETTLDENGYPNYKRRNTNKQYLKMNNYCVDSRHVVPHNKKLLLLLNCHVNVEIVSSIKAVKYLYKYIYKGHDAAAISISNPPDNHVVNHDEIQDFIEGRYVSPVEACWRIGNKELQQESHAVIRLPVHLENQQTITVNSLDSEECMNKALEKQTMLMDYFKLNSRDPEARTISYSEIPSYYVYKKTSKESNTYSWEKRKAQFNVIGRMYSISPNQIELFHLRLLLIHTKGATSFDDLKTVNGRQFDTFVETCLALGLIEDDNEWERALNEAELWMMPQQLRKLFVRILIYCQPVHPQLLWEKFKSSMSQDFQRNFELDVAQSKAYAEISRLLNSEGSNLNNFPTMEQTIKTDENDIINELHEESTIIGKRQYDKLNDKQKDIVDLIYNAINGNSNTSTCFYVNGPGGSGKTFIYTTLYHILKGENKNVCTMAFTGIAATLLPEGKTVHKVFGMPVPLYFDSSSNIKKNSHGYNYLKNIDLFIWDEAPMAPRHALELVDRTLRDILNNDKPFGGKIIVLGGDFRQLLPIKLHATRSETINLSIKFSSLWKYFTKFSLTQNMRALPEEAEFAKFLLSVGEGTLNDKDNYIVIPETLIASANSDIVNDIYGDTIKSNNYEMLTKLAILSPRNVDVDDINNKFIDLLDNSTEITYESIDSTEHCDNGDLNASILIEYLHTLNPPNFPPHILRLRLYSVVMLVRNLSINEGLCNGTRLNNRTWSISVEM